ncbi:10 kDa chaperonin [Capsicum annuum]|nr:10 kDa chaperonin [Capsicum annuum]
MASTQLTASSISGNGFASFEGLRSTCIVKSASFAPLKLNNSSFRGLVVKAATTAAPKYTSLKPLGDRVLVKIKTTEEKTVGGILLPITAQSKPNRGEVVAVGEGHSAGKTKVDISVKTGAKVIYSKYAGTEVEFDGSKHLILKEDDIVGILETDDVKDLQPLNDRVLIKESRFHEEIGLRSLASSPYPIAHILHLVQALAISVVSLIGCTSLSGGSFASQVAEAEEKTAGGLLLSEAAKEKPSIGTIIAVGPGLLDEEGNRKPLSVSPGNTVLYSKYAGNEFKGADGSDYITLGAPDVMAVLS